MCLDRCSISNHGRISHFTVANLAAILIENISLLQLTLFRGSGKIPNDFPRCICLVCHPQWHQSSSTCSGFICLTVFLLHVLCCCAFDLRWLLTIDSRRTAWSHSGVSGRLSCCLNWLWTWLNRSRLSATTTTHGGLNYKIVVFFPFRCQMIVSVLPLCFCSTGSFYRQDTVCHACICLDASGWRDNPRCLYLFTSVT